MIIFVSVEFSKKTVQTLIGIIVLLVVLYLSSLYNYLLFHTLAEIFSIIIAFSIFIIAWNTKKYVSNNYLLWLGIAYLFIGGLDLLHTLSYKGITIFPEKEYFANQLWITARYIESISFFVAFFILKKNIKFNYLLPFFLYVVVFILLVLSIFIWDIFPACFIEGQGQTSFKIISEYIIISLLVVNIFLFASNKQLFDQNIYQLLIWSFVLTILSEFLFTLYVSNYDLANLFGHYFKILSFYFIYQALIADGLQKPFSLMFRELKQSEENLRNLNFTKDRIFSIVAHDLKSPFNSLIGFSELLMKSYDVFSDEERRKLFNMINQSSRKAHGLLENLLQWSRAQTGRLQPQPETFNLPELVKENIQLFLGNAREKEIKLYSKISNDLFVNADRTMINTVIRNLINNAIKFTDKHGEVFIDAEELNGKVAVSVIDSGIGMNKEDIQKLFKADIYHSTLGTAKEKGSGLGLIICKEFNNPAITTCLFKRFHLFDNRLFMNPQFLM